jgi:regulator of replication initiation timing
MPEKQDHQIEVEPRDLFATIGEMTFELKMLRSQNAQLYQENEKLREHNRQMIKQANKPAAIEGD